MNTHGACVLMGRSIPTEGINPRSTKRKTQACHCQQDN